MPLFINTNLSSMTAQRHLMSSAKTLDSASERLASGLRINKAADDAAGLAISNRLTTQVRGLNQAIRNANDGISLIQTTEGALAESTNNLQRIRELSVQAASGTYSDTDRATLNSEVQQLISELDRIANTTSFNGRTLLDGSLGELVLQVGAQSEQTIAVDIPKVDAAALGMNTVNGDYVGDAMVLNGSGLLANAIGQDDLLINGQSLGSLDAGSTVGELVDTINDNIRGVTASTLVELEGTTVGDGITTSSDPLTITVTQLDGAINSLQISDTNSLSELADRINSDTGGQLAGSINNDGKLVVTGSDVASISISDPTGTATGLGGGSLSADSVQQSIVNGLTSYWIREAEDLISTYFDLSAPASTEIDLIFAETDGSLTGDLSGLTAGQQATLVSDGAGGSIAAVWNDPANLKLIVDLADFVSPEGSAPLYNDRVIAHEMVHAVMAARISTPINTNLPGWFTEGIAEFAHGADARVVGDISANTPLGNPTSVGIAAIAGALKTTPGSPSDSLGYSAGYTAVKMLDEAIAANTAFAGIEAVFDELEAGNDLDTALNNIGVNWGSGTGLADFEAYYASTADEYLSDGLNGTNTYASVSIGGISASMDLNDTDTGSVAGSDYGFSVKTAESILPNVASGGPINFDLTLPDGYSAAGSSGSAKLVLTSTDGEGITLESGQTGRLADLAFLGMQQQSEVGVIEGVGITAPDTAWGQGDIEINGVIIDHDDTDSLAGKIAAINAATSQTGVHASAYASATLVMSDFDYDHWSTTNYGDFGINGISITGIGDDTSAEEMVATLNQYTDQTGVSATLKGTDIVLTADRGISIHDVAGTGPDAAIAFGRSDLGNGQILSSSNDVANANAEAVSERTYIEAGMKLQSENGSAISLDVSDAAFSTIGLKSTNNSSGVSGTSLQNLDVSTQAGAQKAIATVDAALEQINDTRSTLGAVNNRLDFTIASLANVMENSAAARSRILDADYASEAARLSASQVMQQASSAMLAQANARPQNVLQLLQ